MPVSVNQKAVEIVELMIKEREGLGINSITLSNGTKVIDAGASCPGGLTAGKLLSKVCIGGLGEIHFTMGKRLQIHVSVDKPAVACMGSQLAGWMIKVGDYFAMGSGPARAKAGNEKIFSEIKYSDYFNKAVIVLETRKAPDEKVARYIAEKCGVDPKDLFILIAPTASIVGSVQISARVVETGVHKLHELGFDVNQILSGFGSAPVAPVARKDLEAMGKTNDCVLYGGRTEYFVSAEDSEIKRLIEEVSSSSSKDYGASFLEIFEKYKGDFYKIDPKLFSPAEVTINNIKTGGVFHSGHINEEILQKSLGI